MTPRGELRGAPELAGGAETAAQIPCAVVHPARPRIADAEFAELLAASGAVLVERLRIGQISAISTAVRHVLGADMRSRPDAAQLPPRAVIHVAPLPDGSGERQWVLAARVDAQEVLDAAVAAAYGWSRRHLSDAEMLRDLAALPDGD